MGLVPSRAWDTEGVTTLRALQAPFLVTSDELAAEIAGSDLADEMLAGLEQDGVVGLALVPEGMRHLFSFRGPILDPADLSGATVRVPKSETSFALFEALGAIPDDLGGPGDRFAAGVASGEVAAAESSFLFAANMPAPATVTANLTLYPKVDTIVINAAVFEALSDEQQEVLHSAAGATRDRAVGATTPDATLAQQLCGQEGVRVVTIGDAAVDAFAEAARSVYDQLEQDHTTAELIDAIRKMSSQLPPPAPVEPCEPGFELAPPVEGDPADLAAFPDGVYRLEITDQDLVAFMPDISRQDIDNNHGIWTWTLSDGHYSIDQRAPGYSWGATGRFEVSGDRITFYLSWIDDFPATFTWRSDGRTLDFELEGDLHPILNATFTAHPWKKIR
ncbi:MAG: TRAP transporter substrate-binding protein DctP, partial [Acidimicrobiia bacterium]